MDTARLLLTLEQGLRSLEDYVQEYLEIAYYSDLPDYVLIDFFCEGINQPLKSQLTLEGPRSSLSDFMDYALLTVGSAFTVGVAEEHDTVLTRVMTATPEHDHKMAVTVESVHKMAATTTPSQATVDHRESSQATVDRRESSQVTVDRRESTQLTADLPGSRHVSADGHESSHVSADGHESSHVSADRPESRHVFADRPESHHVTAVHPESCHVTAVHPESCHVTAVHPEFCHLHLDRQGQFFKLPDWHPAWRTYRWCQPVQLVSLNQRSQPFLFLH